MKNSDKKFPQNLYLWLKISNCLEIFYHKSKQPKCHNVEIRPWWFKKNPIIISCLEVNMFASKSIVMTHIHVYIHITN